MKQLKLLLAILFIGCLSCNGQTNKKDTGKIINVYYFHFTRRCPTCIAVEENSKKALQELYPEKFKSGDMTFSSYNLDEEKNNKLAEKYEVAGQTLLIVKGEKKIDVTEAGFMYAKSDTDKLKAELKKAVESLK